VKNFGRNTGMVVLVGLLSVAAARLVAMRVQVEPIQAVGDKTVMRLIVTIAPEDRSRMGQNVWLTAELRQDDRVVKRDAQAVRLERDGTLRLDVEWPPGRYELRVDVQSADGQASGFWRKGTAVPELAASAAELSSVEVEEPDTGGRPAETAAGSAATAAAAAGSSGADTGRVTTERIESPLPAVEQSSGIDQKATGPETDRLAAETDVSGTKVDAQSAPAAPEAAAPAEVVASTAVITDTAEPPEPVGESVSEEPTWVAGTSDELEFWNDRGHGLQDVTLTVTQRSRPVAGLNQNDFQVKIGGRDTAIETFGRAGESPVFVSLAVQVGSLAPDDQALIRDHLGRLALRATGAGGQVAVIGGNAGVGVEWSSSPMAIRAALTGLEGDTQASTAQLLVGALSAMELRGGRRFVVLVTDGGSEDREGWKRALGKARSAAVPVLVIAFRSDELSERTRRNLERSAAVSGGQRHVLTGTGLLRMVTEYYGELMDSSYVARLQLPSLSKPAKLRISTLAGDRLTVNHSELVE